MNIAEKLKLIAENEPKVYNSGYDNGYGAGYTDGFEKGKEDAGGNVPTYTGEVEVR